MFLAIDPARAGQILFTAPYGIIEGTCLVRADCPCARLGEFDRPGVRIATAPPKTMPAQLGSPRAEEGG